ncbi:MAG: hypothetical protein WCK59_00510 [Candidatus Falkowbacteria bacterium]
MESSKKRAIDLSQALFDHFVRKRFIGEDYIIHGEELNQRELHLFAKAAGCDAESLSSAIYASCGRIGGHKLPPQLPKKDEIEIIMGVIKFYVKGINIPLKNYRRDFGNMAAEINHFNPGLKLKTQELIGFAYPIYRSVFEEIFDVMPEIISIEA